ncbi:MAG: 16S rRNA (uracil(1498)-N(3))-methyltransferase [Planctomycetota bacterium]
MSKRRCLRVESLQGLKVGDEAPLSTAEAHHARVLRLKFGVEIEVADAFGRAARANLTETFTAKIVALQESARTIARLTLATAWPKGKRAALLVEKCSELGVDRIIPVRYARSVVSKGEESEGLARLRRIAAEAAKQCGRNTLPEIVVEMELNQVLAHEAPSALALRMEPTAEKWLLDALADQRATLRDQPLLLFVGPEGGFAPEEQAAFLKAGIQSARVAKYVLRVETAALAACALAQAAFVLSTTH